MKLSYNEMNFKFSRRQTTKGKGPEMLELERSSEVTEPVAESQTTPCHLHGEPSLGFQLESTPSGSSKPSFAWWR